ncbi:MAG: DUF2828 family protein [Lachnospiraceae bacterium]|jgi:hypothetical protein|nr:DUF2828 family protein [Lachnospiraceae bacterium]
MLFHLKKEANYTYTENGALTYASTMDSCLDLFATAGGLRNAKEEEIVRRFVRAYAENADIAMKILFYARDVRGGLGERRLFRIVLRFLCENHKESVVKNLDRIAQLGRFDDFLALMDTACEKEAVDYLKAQLYKDREAVQRGERDISLLAKWLPSVNTSDREKVRLGRKLAKAFGMSEKDYRKTLSILRKKIDILENYLRETDYTFAYEKQPGKALLKYQKAFCRHDGERYGAFMNRVEKGEAVLHTDTLMPYEILRPFYKGWKCIGQDVSEAEVKALETTWYAQKDYAGEHNSLVVIDGSGSMYGGGNPMPALVAQSLGLYFAEKNTGAFANHFITFSAKPKLVEVKGGSLLEKLQYISTFNEVADTNIRSVFELILRTAVKNRIPQKDMPERIFIVSDMEFNYCTTDNSVTNFEYAKKMFQKAGYRIPKIVFWNVASRTGQLPVTKNEQGVTLVSGCNARLFEQVISDHTDPYEYMLKIVDSERYEGIVA